MIQWKHIQKGGMFQGVSTEQPSIIDDLSIRSGFYSCQALALICVPRAKTKEVNCIGSAFVCAENMALEAWELGVSSCIVGRGEATFAHPDIAPPSRPVGTG